MRGISVYCSSCHRVFSEDRKRCQCGQPIRSMSPLKYVVTWYVNGIKRRKFIEESRKAAVNFLRSTKKQLAEGKYIDRDPGEFITLGELQQWYLGLTEVKSKKGYSRVRAASENIVRKLGTSRYVRSLTEGGIDNYRVRRGQQSSMGYASPSTINLEVQVLKGMINRAIRYDKMRHNPIAHIKSLPIDNRRGRGMTHEDFLHLLASCDDPFKGVILLAGYTGMRQMEILDMTWQEVSIDRGEILLPANRTKSHQSRIVPFDLNPKLLTYMNELYKRASSEYVFVSDGEPYDRNKGWREFDKVRRAIGRNNITFHDLRHFAIDRLTRAGYRPALVMDITGHSTKHMHMHYQTISNRERHSISL